MSMSTEFIDALRQLNGYIDEEDLTEAPQLTYEQSRFILDSFEEIKKLPCSSYLEAYEYNDFVDLIKESPAFKSNDVFSKYLNYQKFSTDSDLKDAFALAIATLDSEWAKALWNVHSVLLKECADDFTGLAMRRNNRELLKELLKNPDNLSSDTLKMALLWSAWKKDVELGQMLGILKRISKEDKEAVANICSLKGSL